MFWWKKMTPKLVVLQVVKKLQVLEKKIFSKQKNPSRLFVQITPTKRCAETVLHHKIINETRSTKNQENSAHLFKDNYLTNHPVKFLQDTIKPWRVGALGVCTGYHFFLRKLLVRAFQPPLTSRVVYLNGRC